MYNFKDVKVLITDTHTRKSFDLANILRSNGIEIVLCDSLNSVDRHMLEAAYGQKVELLRKKEYFGEDLFKLSQKYREYKLVYFPIEEDTTLLYYEAMQNYHIKNIYSNLPKKEIFNMVRDKEKFSYFCEENGLPVPKRYDYEEIVAQRRLPSPLICKPKSGSGSVGIHFVDSYEAFEKLDIDFKDYIIQERLENPKDIEGGFFLMERGEVVTYYGHKRLRTYPPSGGVSVYSRCDLNPALKVLGERLLKQLGWSGIAMVEFLYDTKSKSYKIIELNPRAWGSLMLSEFCGSSLIENYCLSALGQEPKQSRVESERYIRWFFPWDLLSYIQRKGKISHFWALERERTCYINFSYTSLAKGLLFMLYNMVNPQKLKRLKEKVFAA